MLSYDIEIKNTSKKRTFAVKRKNKISKSNIVMTTMLSKCLRENIFVLDMINKLR